jgi:hypothetical protein
VQLDQARIAIAERAWVDNLDLALHIARRSCGPLLVYALAGMLPLALANHLLFRSAAADVEQSTELVGSIYWLMILIMIEVPLATAPMTLYLGKALFEDRPSPRHIVRDYWASLPQMLLLQVVLRAILIVPVVTWFIPYVIWPYLNEVILLERNPLVAKPGQVSTRGRNRILHGANGGEFLARGLVTMLLAPLLIGSLFAAQYFLLQSVLGIEPAGPGTLVGLQVVAWLVVGYFTVARFLSYLDQRIRNEGWEVELLLRAQRERLLRQIA